MFVDPTTVTLTVLTGVALWQQWSMMQVQQDLDEVINSHNDFVETMIELLEEASKGNDNDL